MQRSRLEKRRKSPDCATRNVEKNSKSSYRVCHTLHNVLTAFFCLRDFFFNFVMILLFIENSAKFTRTEEGTGQDER
ncbi:unnamed protein product [Ixodes persulcatus]